MIEAALQTRILLALGGRPDVRLFLNTMGQDWTSDTACAEYGLVLLFHARRVTLEICSELADLIDWRRVSVKTDVLGQQSAVFFATQVKSPRTRIANVQARSIEAVRAAGSLAGIARSEAEAREVTRC